MKLHDVVIIGAGLGGLRTATLLADSKRDTLILEADSRLGGRILSVDAGASSASGRFDMGPAWFWPEMQPRMRRLVTDLGLDAYEQEATGEMLLERSALRPAQRVPTFTQEPASFRIAGGMAALIEGLVAQLSPDQIQPNHCVKRVENDTDAVVVHCLSTGGMQSTVRCRQLVIAMPPRLAAETIAFAPGLPLQLERAMRQTPTWMAGQAKYVAVYRHPFWRDSGLSGAARSTVGPLVEIHDASIPNGPTALFGFVGLSAAQRQLAGPAWEAAALAQMIRLFGTAAGSTLAVHVQDWAQSPLTATAQDWPPLTIHPQYGALPDPGSVWRDRLVWAGTETAPGHGGYLEGALEAAERVAAALR